MINVAEPMQDHVVVIEHRAQEVDCFGWGDFPAVTTGPIMFASSLPCGSPFLVEDASMDSSTSSYDMDTSAAAESFESLTKRNEQRRQVRFNAVQVREHALIIGDHPWPDEYPLSLDWKHTSPMHYDVDEYELHYRKTTTCFVRSSSPQACPPQRLSPADRRLRLAAVNGESISELCQQETDRRRKQLKGSLPGVASVWLSHPGLRGS